MKLHGCALIATTCLAGVVLGQDDTAKTANGQNGGKFIVPATHESLSEKAKNSPDPIQNLKKIEVSEAAAKASMPAPPKSLSERCHILHRADMATYVPKQSILHMPDSLRGTIVTTTPEGVKFVTWQEFLTNNRSWIRVKEVTREQAEGREAFPKEFYENLKDVGQVIVATYQAGPIDVLPVKEEKPADEKEAGEEKTENKEP